MKYNVRGLIYLEKPVLGGKYMVQMLLEDTEAVIDILEEATQRNFSKLTVKQYLEIIQFKGELYLSHNVEGVHFSKLLDIDSTLIQDLILNNGGKLYLKGSDIFWPYDFKDVIKIRISRDNYLLGYGGDANCTYHNKVLA